MKLDRLAADYLKRAESRIKGASAAYKRKDHPDVVRYSQEIVELCLKAALRLVGIEYPKEHHVGDLVEVHRERFPLWFSHHANRLSRISAELAEKRAPSMYGLEPAGKTPSELFGEADAKASMDDATFVYKNIKKLYHELTKM